MAVLPLVIAPDERLNQPSEPVEAVDDGVRQLIKDMFDTMYANHGIGLAAVQVGVHQRIIVVDTEWGSARYADEEDGGAQEKADDAPRPGRPLALINPEIIEESEDHSVYKEGCLSFPDNYSDVERPAHVTVRYLDEQGEPQTLQADELLATCIQHEIDHTNGVVFVDHISRLKRDMILRRLQKAKKLGTIPVEQTDTVKV